MIIYWLHYMHMTVTHPFRLHSLRKCTITTQFHHLSILWSAPKLFVQRMYIILHNRFLEMYIAKIYIYTLRLSFRAQQSMQGNFFSCCLSSLRCIIVAYSKLTLLTLVLSFSYFSLLLHMMLIDNQ